MALLIIHGVSAAIMHVSNFIKIIEEEYDKVVVKSKGLKSIYEPKSLEKPSYICEQVQKFRTWLVMAMRTVDVWDDTGSIMPEDALIRAAVSKSASNPGHFAYPKMVSMISLFDQRDFMGIFSQPHREQVESALGLRITRCKFMECYPFCPNFF